MRIISQASGIHLIVSFCLFLIGCSDRSNSDDDGDIGTNETMMVESSEPMSTEETMMVTVSEPTTNVVDRSGEPSEPDDQTPTEGSPTQAAPLPASGGAFGTGVNCDIGGNWSGTFFNDVSGARELIRATVTITGLDVTIRTNRLRPPGQLFTGSANGQCGLRLIDAYDGEDWTTKFGGADGNQLRIADFQVELRDPLTDRAPLNIIELFR